MDLNTITEVSRPDRLEDWPAWRDGDAALAGGTWLFSEPQPSLRRLIDLAGLGWDELEAGDAGLRIGAMCTLGRLAAFAASAPWAASPLIGQCCDALLGSFKVQGVATVGGNLCMALPAGPMAALAVALGGICTIHDGAGAARAVPAADFVTGPHRTVLRPGELLRALELPAAALAQPAAFRRISLAPLGRSAALLVGTGGNGFALTVTASTTRPVRLAFPGVPGAAALRSALRDAIPDGLLYDDVHGRPAWRRQVTEVLAEEIRQEIGGLP